MDATAALASGIALPLPWAPVPLPFPLTAPPRQRPNTRHYAQGLFEDALRHHRAGRISQAVTRYRKALSYTPDHADAHNNIGVALIALGKPIDAIAHYRRAIAINPGHRNAHSNLGTALVSQGRLADAVVSYQRAVALNPRQADAHYNLGIALAAQGKSEDAQAAYEAALRLKCDHVEAHNNLANLLLVQGRTDEAIAHYHRALAADPTHANSLNNLGNALRDQGRLDEALEQYDRAIAIRPVSAEAHYHRAEIKTFRSNDLDLAALESLARRTDLPTAKAPFIHFALAKALEDTGEFTRSFHHLRLGNRIRREQIYYDERGTTQLFRRTSNVFDRQLFERLRGSGDPSSAPIFILGMPRSGSTLIEQILASHPQIHGAGEREDLAECLPPNFPECVTNADAETLRGIGQAYVSRMPQGKLRVVNKLPDNFLRIGLIHLALPNARIIHTVRNPIDTCASCYSKLFAAGQNFSYELGELGRYYRHYSELMEHWRSVLPAEAVLDVAYEDVIGDLEGQARRLIEYCGLPWDDRCLEFHKTKRTVRTASSVQVRKPLFRSSVERWKKYETGLDPLLKELLAGHFQADPPLMGSLVLRNCASAC